MDKKKKANKTRGILPKGFNNVKYPAMLKGGEAVIPLDKLEKFIKG